MRKQEKLFSHEEEFRPSSESTINKNISFARQFYKQNKPDKRIQFSVSNSGSSHAGTVKNAILYLSYVPNVNEKFPNMSLPISTFSDVLEFRFQLSKGYEVLIRHLKKLDERKNSGKLYSKPKIPKKGSNSIFKDLAEGGGYDTKGW